jgi:drug/metabolite transporter (DMT)-like permease
VATAFKLTLRELSPAQLLFCANLFSLVALLGWLAYSGRLSEAVPARSHLRSTLVLGLLNPFIYYAVLFKAYDLLPAQVAQPTNYTWAFALAALSVPMLGKRISVSDIVGGLIAYGGVWLICFGAGDVMPRGLSPLGLTLALGSTIIWALFWILLTRDGRDTEVALCSAFAFSLPFTFGYAMLDGLAMPSVGGLAGAAWVGFFEMGITFVLWGRAVKYAVSVARVATLIFLSPFLSLVFIHFILREPVRSTSLIGLAVIVAGLLVQKRFRGACAR